MLFAKSHSGRFQITTCLLPKQKGTHDSCTTTNEEQIWEFQCKKSKNFLDKPDSSSASWIDNAWLDSHTSRLSGVSVFSRHAQSVFISESSSRSAGACCFGKILSKWSLLIKLKPNYKEIGAFRLTDIGVTVIGKIRKINCSEQHV